MSAQECGSREVITLSPKPFLHEVIKLQRAVMGAGARKALLGLSWMEDAQCKHPGVDATS